MKQKKPTDSTPKIPLSKPESVIPVCPNCKKPLLHCSCADNTLIK